MKKYSFVLVLMLFISPFMAQTIPSYVPSNGLVGWWPFNGNANDESGNGNNGTVNGAALSADRDGKLNGAYSFDGVDDFILCSPNKVYLNSKSFSWSFWVKKNTLDNSGIFLTQGDPKSNTGLHLCYTANSIFRFGFYNNDLDTKTSNLDINNWYLYSGTYDATTKERKLYINGVLNNTDKAISDYLGSGALYFGGTYSNTVGWGKSSINGKLDDIGIWNRVLTQVEITNLYNGSLCPPLALNLTQPTCFVKTGQVDILSPKGTGYSYSIDGKTFQSDTIFRLVNPGTYNVSIKHTSGCSNTKSTSFTINPVPTSLTSTTTPVGPLKICEGSSIKMSANTGKNYTYQWCKDKTAIKGATSSTYEATKAGKYIVFVNDGACKDSSDVVIIDTIPLPAAPVINNSYLKVCNMMPREEVARQFQIDLNYKWYRSETGTDSLQKYEPLIPGYMQYYLSQFSATNPACESKKRTMITVDVTMSPQINYPGTTTFCQGDSIKLETNSYFNNPWEYVWAKDNNWIQGSDGKSSIIVKETGLYSIFNMKCMNQSSNQNIYITFNPTPDAKISFSGSTILPVGGSLTLTVTDKAGNKYEWYKNGTLIQGASANSYLVKEIGKYSVKVTNGTCSASSIPVDVTGTIDPKPVLTNTGKKTFCSGDSTTLKVDAINAVFEWLKDGQTIKGAVNASFVAKQTGIYSVKVTKNNVAQTTDTLHITVFDNPKVDIKDISTNIQQEIPTFVLKNQKSIQLLGIPSGGKFSGQGITNSVFNPSTLTLGKKLITYSFTSLQGCNGTASRATIVVDSVGNVCNVTNTIYDTILKLKFKLTTGLQADKLVGMSLYPNPTSDVLHIEVGDAKALDGYRYRIVDALGKEVYNELVKNAITGIPMKTLGAAGMYQFEVLDQKNVRIQTKKIVLQ